MGGEGRTSAQWLPHHIVIMLLHGISGASGGGPGYDGNEQLLAAAFLRVAQHKEIPVIFGTDVSIDPKELIAVQQAMDAGIIHDAVQDTYTNAPPPTFRKGCVYDGMTGSGCTRIDTIFYNLPSSHARHNLAHGSRYDTKFDQVPIELQIIV